MAIINGKKILSVVKTQAVAVDIEANPAGAATETLEKLKVGTTIYGVEGGGSNVEANPSDAATAALGKLKVGTTTYSVPSALSDLSDDATHRVVTDTEKSTWNNKSDFSGDYDDLSNKPTIPAEVIANPTLAGTESELAGLQIGTTKYKVPTQYMHYITLKNEGYVGAGSNFYFIQVAHIMLLRNDNTQLGAADIAELVGGTYWGVDNEIMATGYYATKQNQGDSYSNYKAVVSISVGTNTDYIRCNTFDGTGITSLVTNYTITNYKII